VTSKTKSDLNEIKDEYEDYRKRALVREQEVVRELYDEILKYKNKLKQLGHNIS
jgi:DNA mismatch repair ATPase MutS